MMLEVATVSVLVENNSSGNPFGGWDENVKKRNGDNTAAATRTSPGRGQGSSFPYSGGPAVRRSCASPVLPPC